MMNKNLDIALWIALIIGRLAASKGIGQHEAFGYLRQTDALSFLLRNYEVEHLENPLNVLEDIEQFILSNKTAIT
jgi:hypothetical protein